MSRSRRPEEKSFRIDHFDESIPFVIRGFLQSIEAMALKPQEVVGDVFVIGHGQVFPERGLLFLPDDRYGEKLRPAVRSLVTSEPEFSCNPSNTVFGLETQHRAVDPTPETPQQDPRVIDYYTVGAGYLLENWPESVQFDTVTMFRLPHMERVLREQDLLADLAKHVRPGGRFICSGSFDTERPPGDPHWRVERPASGQTCLKHPLSL